MTSQDSAKQSTGDNPKRRKVLVRAQEEDLPRIEFTARDLEILHAVYECRALTTQQIQRRFFPAQQGSRGGLVSCQQRLKLLFHHGYLHRDEQAIRLREGRAPLVYFLDKPGAAVLAKHLQVEVTDLDWHPRDNAAGAGQLFLTHLLKTNDVRIALELAAAQTEWQLHVWLDERNLRRRQMKDYVEVVDDQGRMQQMALVPDSYFALMGPDAVFHHFLEIDLRTTTGASSRSGHRDWVRRVQAYMAYHRSGRYQARYQSSFFRVLTVTTSERRLAHLKEITEQARGGTEFWYTSFPVLSAETALTAPIWQVAGQEEPLALLF